ncbi:class I tRNA ligase family protein [Microvirga pakistanensis]|uniref:class I tRNA ligase family protein n=1 Tax=Microvirga pakistanensis TaxID=1682650 RepID=UPI001FCE3F12|nr:class I tRNA ligase family protein [Microvirga pakistanensis]
MIGSGEPWKTVDVIKGVNWLTFEGGKFSTCERRGIFLDQALDLLPADNWRWWLAANAPEGNDTDFTFDRFGRDVNNDLADTFGNLVNRTLTFVASRFQGTVPEDGVPSEPESGLERELEQHLNALRRYHASCSLRKAADEVRAIWRLANGYLQVGFDQLGFGEHEPIRLHEAVDPGIGRQLRRCAEVFARRADDLVGNIDAFGTMPYR